MFKVLSVALCLDAKKMEVIHISFSGGKDVKRFLPSQASGQKV